MPSLEPRLLGLRGLGDLQLMPSSLEDFWQDCDKVLVTPAGELRGWPGFNRRGFKLARPAVHGAAREKIQIIRASERYLRKSDGHLLAAVDRSTNTDGRVLALAHHRGGLKGTELVGSAIQTTGSGLDDLEARGVFSGAAAALYIVEIDGVGTPDTFQWSNDGGSTYEATAVAITGEWQTLENGIEIKFAATTGHTDEDTWSIPVGGRPMVAAEMDRQGPHNYPSIVGAAGKSLITHGYNEVLVDDGIDVRAAGVRAPQIKPAVRAASILDTEVGDTDTNPTNWEAAAEGVVVSRQTSSPCAPDGTAYIKIDPPWAELGEIDLAYVNSSGTLATTTKRVRAWLRFDSNAPSAKEHFSLVFCSGTALSGDRVELIFPDSYAGNQWHQVDLVVDQESNFAFQSIGFRLKKLTYNPATMYLDGIRLAADGDVPSSTLFAGAEQWRFCFTWYRREDGYESAPSPLSDSIELAGKAVELDLSGVYPCIEDDLPNAAPADFDAIHVYGSKPSFGVDPALGGQQFFRLSPSDGFSVDGLQKTYETSVSADAGNTGDGTAEDIYVLGDIPTQTLTLTATGSGPGATFTVTSSEGGSFANATSGTAYQSDNDVIRFKITDGSAAWASSDELTITITRQVRSDGKLVIKMADPITISALTSQPRPPFWMRQVEPADAAAADGNLIVLGGQQDYSVGEWTWTLDSHILAPVAATTATTPIIARWMEGRTIRQQDSATRYRIVKTLDQDGDGVLDALWVARYFDSEKQEFSGPFEGATGDAKGIIEGDQQSIWWTNHTERSGVDVESSSVLNRLKIMPVGDYVTAIGKAGEFLWVLGRSNAFVLRQNPSALADIPTDAAYLDPLHIPSVGIMGRRCWTALPGGGAMFLNPKGELYVVSTNGGAQRHQISDNLSAVLGGWGHLTNTRELTHSFIEHISNGRDELLYIGLIGGGQVESDVAPGVRRKATDIWRDHEASGGEQVITEGYVEDWPDMGFSVSSGGTSTTGGDGEDFLDHIDMLSDGGWVWFDAGAAAHEADVAVDNDASSSPAPPATESWTSPDADSDADDNPFGLTGSEYNKFTITLGNYFQAGGSAKVIARGQGDGENTRAIHSTVTYLAFQIHSTKALAAGALGLRFSTDVRDVTNVDAIPAGAWTYVRFSTPYEDGDLNGNNEPGYEYGYIALLDMGTEDLGASGDVVIGITNGRQVVSSEVSTADSPKEPLSFESAYCVEPGSTVETAALDQDFQIGLIADLKSGRIFLGSECRFTCAGVRPSVDCTPEVVTPGPPFFGDRDGYANLVFDDKVLTWGSPSNRFLFDVASATSTTVTIDRSFDGAANALSLSLDDDGNGLLDQLLVAKLPSSYGAAVEFRRISSSTIDTITVSAAWDSNPAAGDQIVIGPLAWLVHWSETRRRRPFLLRSLAATFEQGAIAIEGGWTEDMDPRLRLEVFTATGQANRVTSLTPVLTKHFSADEFEKGRGFVRAMSKASKAASYRLMCLQGHDAPTLARELAVEERGQ